MRLPSVLCLTLALVAALSGCVPLDEVAEPSGASVSSGYYGTSGAGRFDLARTDERVKTIQLFNTQGGEASLPVVALNSGQSLTLAFDLLGDGTGEPLSVYFYHADRTWRRDLVPAEFLRAFLSDDLFDYRPSGGTQVRYVHYSYAFPNANIDFTISGNYIVRVTEQGDERAVLFERAFLVSEDAAEIDFGFQTGFASGGSVIQPVVRLRPGGALQNAQPFDYRVCFLRNGRLGQARCADEPSLIETSLLQFALPRQQAFAPDEPLYELDLGLLRIGPQVADVDYGTDPYTVTLDLDYARFGSEVTNASLTGQPVVTAVYQDGGTAATEAEYVDVRFRYVPEGDREAPGRVLLSGSFNNWQLDPANALTWVPEEGRYEGALLLKQGLYLYRYFVDDPAAPDRGRTLSLQPDLYTALVYLYDTTRLTDRLVAFRSVLSQ